MATSFSITLNQTASARHTAQWSWFHSKLRCHYLLSGVDKRPSSNKQRGRSKSTVAFEADTSETGGGEQGTQDWK
eukprot:171624-Amphidinium_carterae.1